MTNRVGIQKLKTGVSGLDEVLGGGLPEYSFNLIAGGPGCGKTTLMHQLVFANATRERPALYFTILGEPPLKMLRYQQQFEFFDPAMLDGRVRFVHLGQDLVDGGMEKVLESVIREVDSTSAGIVVVDSFRSALPDRDAPNAPGVANIQYFVQRLALHLTSREATTFLVGEYMEQESNSNPLFTIADGIVWLYQSVLHNSVVRRLQVLKLRGQQEVPGLHTFRISTEGVRVFPRLPQPLQRPQLPAPGLAPNLTGSAGLDALLGGGIPAGSSVLVAGPSGAGKTVLTSGFIAAGAEAGEASVVAVFEKRPEEYLDSSPRAGILKTLVSEGRLALLYLRPLDLSLDETMEVIRAEVHRLGARRVVLDSLSGLELALAPVYREDFRESLYRLVGGLTALGVTVMMTVEVADSFTELRFSPHGISFLTDVIIIQRFVEHAGKLQKILSVVKVRGQDHSSDLRPYEIGRQGLVVGDPIEGVSGLLTGRAIPGAGKGPG